MSERMFVILRLRVKLHSFNISVLIVKSVLKC